MKTLSEVPGIAVLLIGIALLVTVFIDAYLFLIADVNILPLPNLTAALGEALAPLIEAAIRMIYIAIMVWIGSTITRRGITVLLQVIPETKPEMPKTSKKTETIKSKAESKKTKTEAKPKIPKETKTKEEPKNIEEAWEKAFQETNLETKST